MKTLLTVKSAVELLAGLVFALVPSWASVVLFGERLDTSVSALVARIAGVALLAIAIACWMARADSASPAARGLIVALLLYDVAFLAVLVYARLGVDRAGIGLWPVVFLHFGLGVYSVLCLRRLTPVGPGA